MSSTVLRLPDGSEADSSAVICEGCGLGVDGHACGGATAPAPVTVTTRSTGKRKDPHERPQCPHCGGAVHFSMPGALQNMECIMRQCLVSNGAITDPFQRLPLATALELKAAAEWAIANNITYGRMESAAGGAGTYTSLRPKAEPKPKAEGDPKPKARRAKKGERIEDVAAAIAETVEPSDTLSSESEYTEVAEAAVDPADPEMDYTVVCEGEAPEPEITPEPEATPEVDTSAQAREERRAQRRALLAARR